MGSLAENVSLLRLHARSLSIDSLDEDDSHEMREYNQGNNLHPTKCVSAIKLLTAPSHSRRYSYVARVGFIVENHTIYPTLAT